MKLKKDRYAKVRGASKILNLYCSDCGNMLFKYQKDGSGALIRLYFDRFLWPETFAQDCRKLQSKNQAEPLKCPHCQQLLATAMVYEKEKRLAYRIVPGKIISKAN